VLEAEPSLDLLSVKHLDAQRELDATIDGSAEGYVEVSKRLSLSALVKGRVIKAENHRTLTLSVLSGRDGRRVGRIEYQAATFKELREQVSANLWERIRPLLEQTGALPEKQSEETTEPETGPERAGASEPMPRPRKRAAPRPAAPSEEAPAAEPVEPPRAFAPPARRGASCSWLEIMPRGGLMLRSYSYEGEQSGALRSYVLDRAPVAGLGVSFYPGALSSCNFASGLGLSLGFDQMFPVTSEVAAQELDTIGFTGRAELVLRLSFGSFTVEPGLGYYRRRFEVEKSYVPDVDYQALGGRVRLGLRLSAFVAELDAGGRYVLDTGQFGTEPWFPEASGFALEGSLLLGVAPVPFLDIFVSANLERYVFSLNQPGPSNPLSPPAHPNGVADGARDQYVSFMGGLRFRLSKRASP